MSCFYMIYVKAHIPRAKFSTKAPSAAGEVLCMKTTVFVSVESYSDMKFNIVNVSFKCSCWDRESHFSCASLHKGRSDPILWMCKAMWVQSHI